MNSIRRSVFYTRTALLSNANADLALKSKPIRRLARKSIYEITEQLSKRQITVLEEAALKLANKNIVYVINSGGQPTASNTARLLAVQSAQSGRSVVLCDTTSQHEKENKRDDVKDSSGISLQSLNDNFSLMTGAAGSSFFTSKPFNKNIKDLSEQFDQIFICTNTINSQIGLLALLEFAPGLVMVSGLRKTKKSFIKKIKTRQPVDLLFYD